MALYKFIYLHTYFLSCNNSGQVVHTQRLSPSSVVSYCRHGDDALRLVAVGLALSNDSLSLGSRRHLHGWLPRDGNQGPAPPLMSCTGLPLALLIFLFLCILAIIPIFQLFSRIFNKKEWAIVAGSLSYCLSAIYACDQHGNHGTTNIQYGRFAHWVRCANKINGKSFLLCCSEKNKAEKMYH